jgi:hypothetical protein
MRARKQRSSAESTRGDAARYDPLAFVVRHPTPDEIVAEAITRLKSDLREAFKTTNNA